MPEPRAFASAATLNREIFLWGGLKDALNEDGYLLSTNSVLVYNNDLSKWEHHMTVGTMKHAAAIAKCGKLIYRFFNISCTFMKILLYPRFLISNNCKVENRMVTYTANSIDFLH